MQSEFIGRWETFEKQKTNLGPAFPGFKVHFERGEVNITESGGTLTAELKGDTPIAQCFGFCGANHRFEMESGYFPDSEFRRIQREEKQLWKPQEDLYQDIEVVSLTQAEANSYTGQMRHMNIKNSFAMTDLKFSIEGNGQLKMTSTRVASFSSPGGGIKILGAP